MEKGIFGLVKLTEDDIEAILATGDIFTSAPLKKEAKQ